MLRSYKYWHYGIDTINRVYSNFVYFGFKKITTIDRWYSNYYQKHPSRKEKLYHYLFKDVDRRLSKRKLGSFLKKQAMRDWTKKKS